MPDVDGRELLRKNAPPNWGKDQLTSFLEHAYSHCWATFNQKQPQIQKLICVDACFLRNGQGWINPKQNMLACAMFFRCHAAFRAMCRLAMSGQIAETAPTGRVALEFAAAALRIHKNEDLAYTFLNRHDGEAEFKASKNEFSASRYKEELSKISKYISRKYDELYKELIDYGAHPNERGFSTSTLQNETEDGGCQISQVILHPDGPDLDFCLDQTYRTGIFCLEINEITFSSRFSLLSIGDKIFKMNQNRDFSVPYSWQEKNQ